MNAVAAMMCTVAPYQVVATTVLDAIPEQDTRAVLAEWTRSPKDTFHEYYRCLLETQPGTSLCRVSTLCIPGKWVVQEAAQLLLRQQLTADVNFRKLGEELLAAKFVLTFSQLRALRDSPGAKLSPRHGNLAFVESRNPQCPVDVCCLCTDSSGDLLDYVHLDDWSSTYDERRRFLVPNL